MIRALLADDSSLILNIMKEVIESDPEIKVVGTARSGKEVISWIKMHEKPDILILDLFMPFMNGYETVEHVMGFDPVPILILTSTKFDKEPTKKFELLEGGALEIMHKPEGGVSEEYKKELIQTIKLLSKVKVVTHLRARKKRREDTKVKSSGNISASDVKGYWTLVIGSSTGGPKAVFEVLSKLNESLVDKLAIAIAQHIDVDFLNDLALWLDKYTPFSVKAASIGDKIVPGKALLLPTHLWTALDFKGKITYVQDHHGYVKPSIDLLFSSAAKSYGSKCIATILTGMGNDGEKGIIEVKSKGGYTIAQDESTSLIFSMPKSAINTGMVDVILPVDKIAEEINNKLKEEK